MMDELLLPLFPLQVVLFPGELLPLHIFEDRYKEMIRQCLERDEEAAPTGEFGVVWLRGNQLQPIGCTARVAQVIRHYDDGRLDILTQGLRRFEIILTDSEKAYVRGAVSFFFDDDESIPPDADETERALQLFREVLSRLHVSEELTGAPEPLEALSFRIARTLPLALELKQQILAMRSEAARLRGLMETIRKLIPALDLRGKSRAHAGGNGDVQSLRKPQ